MLHHPSSAFIGPEQMQADVRLFNGVGSYNAQFLELSSERPSVSLQGHDSLYVCLFRNTRRARYKVAGRSFDREKFAAGEIFVQPADADLRVDFETSIESYGLMIPQTAIKEIGPPAAFPNAHTFGSLLGKTFRSPLVQTVLERLQTETSQKEPNGPLYSDALINALVCEVHALARLESKQGRPIGATLDARTLDLLEAYISAHLEDRIRMPDLAGALDMEQSYFSAALKNTLGMTPYQMVLQRRVDAARAMIQGSELALAEIAHRCGFSSQSHMTGVFTKKTGLTPAAIRQSA